MTDTEERIDKLQKLLDRVLSRGDEDDTGAGATVVTEVPVAQPGEMRDETPQPAEEEARAAVEEVAAVAPEKEQAPVEEKRDEESVEPEKPAEAAPAPLESRSRLVAAPPESAEELSEDDLIPESRVPASEREDAVPLVRRSRVPVEPRTTGRRVREADEELSDGRIVLGLEDVQISDESLMSEEERLAAEIAAEEVQSGEIEEDAPTSSRRPIAIETIPRDEPPESGKQVALAPASGEEVTAVRKSSTPPAPEPDVIRPDLGAVAAAPVAQFTGASPAARPSSFGELLDEALRL
jgi:hypothetical protein